MTEDLLKLGVQAAKAGDYEKARTFFVKVVQADPNSERGWLYLGHCLSDGEKKNFCYQRVLKINPSNPQAIKALAMITRSERVAPTNQVESPSVPETKQQNEISPKKKSSTVSTPIIIGTSLGVILCLGIFFAVALFRGLLAGRSYQLPSSIPFINNVEATATVWIVTPSFVTEIPTTTPYPVSTSIGSATPIPTFPVDEFSSTEFYNNSNVAYWSQIIAQDPGNADAYFQRASAIYKSNQAIGSLDAYISKLELALQDTDMAISLRSDIGEYYALRQSIYYSLSNTTIYSVDREYVSEIALDNAYKAYELGTTTEYPERIIMDDLIATNQCEKALSGLQELIAQSPPGDVSVGGLLHYRSRAYACLGRLEEALQSVNDSMFNNMNMEHKTYLKILYLIMLERYDEALPLLNERIAGSTLGGDHYYMRAYIYYYTGKKDLVQEELYTGMPKTWERGEFLPFVEAQLALDEGRTEDAIQLLQIAEATFIPPMNPLRWKAQKQLEALDAHPLTPSVSAPYQATPIP
jgi:tetratricopeptide (TPR) repeat protein